MSTLTLTVGGVNMLPQYKTNSAKITAQLQNRGNSMTIEFTKIPSGLEPTEGAEIVLKDGARFLFAGYITRVEPREMGKGSQFVYQVEATDYTYILINKNAQITYENKTLQYIVEDLIDTYVATGYSFTYTGVDVGPTISTISFNHITLRKCFEKLSEVTGYEWWVDYQKNVYFKQKSSSVAPETIKDSTSNFSSIKINCDVTQVRNSIVVKGGREETSTYFSQKFLGDGKQREWILREKPKELQYIKLNGVSKVTAVDLLNDETGNDFMWNYQEKYIRATTTTTTPISTDEIEVSYKYEVPIIIKLRSASSMALMSAIEGGDGLHEFTISDTSIKSKAEARDRALKELEEYANPLINGVFYTRTGLLSAGSYFIPGQAVTLNLPTWGISVDTEYQIQEVQTTLNEDGTTIEYEYAVRFGGRLVNAVTFLERLASKEQVILDTEEIDRIEAITEELTITETITRNNNVKTISETVSIAESISRTNVTPPFKWAPHGTSAKLVWGKGEWS